MNAKEFMDKATKDLDKIAMIDWKHHSIVISPYRALEHGITNIEVAHNKFGSKTLMRLRFDWLKER